MGVNLQGMTYLCPCSPGLHTGTLTETEKVET